jgi:hypothetical protein
MARWSLRRRHSRRDKADTGAYPPGAYRTDPYPPDEPVFASGGSVPVGVPVTAAMGAETTADLLPLRPGGAWPDICEQFSLDLLGLAEQLRISLDELESDESDPDRLQRLYRVDHAVTRMRRASRDLRTLAGRGGEELAGPVTSLLDVIRMALSAIERYTQVTITRVAELAVLGYAADDVGELLAALLDNATRYSPGAAAVSAHLTGDGSVLFRVEDSGIGMEPDTVDGLNAMLAGPIREIDARAGLHTGFPVVHRIARKHQIAVRLAFRPGPASGTIAMVTLPAYLLCEIPVEPLLAVGAAGSAPAADSPAAGGVTTLSTAARRTRVARTSGPQAPRRTTTARAPGGPSDDGLPRREPASLRDSMRAGTGDGLREQRSPEERAAARRAFADDIAAFSLGSQETPGKGTAP